MKISNEKLNEIIKEIAEQMECSCVSYFNPKTLELISLPAQIIEDGDSDGFFESEMEIIENRAEEFICFETLESSDSFRIMENFVESLPKSTAEKALFNAINGPKPFRNFNHIIHDSEFRNDWFEFRKNAYIDYVNDILESRLSDFEN
jgi:Uncharacterised protein family (UPF0158)